MFFCLILFFRISRHRSLTNVRKKTPSTSFTVDKLMNKVCENTKKAVFLRANAMCSDLLINP